MYNIRVPFREHERNGIYPQFLSIFAKNAMHFYQTLINIADGYYLFAFGDFFFDIAQKISKKS